MNIKTYKNIYLVGIGGIGMSALANYFYSQNKNVYGYDRVKSTLTENLEKKGVEISYEDNINSIPLVFNSSSKDQLVIYSSAISNNNILSYFSENSYDVCKRSKALGLISEHYYTIAVAGTHGKTTTSIMLSHILKQSNVNCTAFLGGISKNYDTNFLLSDESKYMVVEADEFDRSFLSLNPDIAIITSLDSDHLDIYGSYKEFIDTFQKFASQVKKNGYLILEESIVNKFETPKHVNLFTYSHSSISDFYASSLNFQSDKINFLYNEKGKKYNNNNVELSMPGNHNVSNALAAISACSLLDISNKCISQALNSFEGIKRRFDLHVNSSEKVYIDDYAHHPTEIIETIKTVKKMFVGRHLTVLFQPHLFSRTDDFKHEFAQSLSLADSLILLDIYPAREKPINGVDSKMLLDLCVNNSKKLISKNLVVNNLENQKIDILLTIGAGDIADLVVPIRKMISS
ncbi:MAG: UDP-N-acetylmuramate--L-alanine ligase [Flavobacteriales bacterium]|nr:UDP-N-acetylmuramate--L-alanine ligase [Flavobacteriales bacterium]OUW97858.1 MAG: UDP-N-acetylmuramate--L-alanine ligase [Flavobacteriales bacterium TMED228]|tara:strand:- start:161 stop:1540 length:1380 start_codon:yes stop_codon:yes gene_type:complete